MAAHVRTVAIPEADRRELQRWARSKGASVRVVERARIKLLRRNDSTGPAGALTFGSRGFGGGVVNLPRTVIDKGQVVDDIYDEATCWLSPNDDNDEDGMDDDVT